MTGFLDSGTRNGCLNNVVQGHHDIRSNVVLRPDRIFGSEFHLLLRTRVFENDVFLCYVAEFGKRHHLESPRVSEDVAFPVHERVQTPFG
jgi:hypothetical protein